MPRIDPEDGYLTVLNLFKTDSRDNVDTLVGEMKAIVDTADFPGWISSTVHRGEEKPGTANFIQWRGMADLESRYQDNEFKHHTVPVFREITSYVRLMQTEVVSSHRHPAEGDTTEVSPQRDDYTVIEVLGVEPSDQQQLVHALEVAQSWLVDVPGYRSQSLLRGIRSRNLDGGQGTLARVGVDHDFVVVYSQWESKEAYDAFREMPTEEWPAGRAELGARTAAIVTEADWNGYRAVHSRSAPEPAAV